MKRFAEAAMTENAMRVKLLDLLPIYASRMYCMLKATSLDDLANFEDELVAREPSVPVINRRPRYFVYTLPSYVR